MHSQTFIHKRQSGVTHLAWTVFCLTYLPPSLLLTFCVYEPKMETITDSLLVKIRPLETSQDWPQFKEGLQQKLEYHSLYKYIESDVPEPTKIAQDGYSYIDKWQLDTDKTKAIIQACCGDIAKEKLKEMEQGLSASPHAIYKHLKKEFSKQNAYSLGTLHKIIAKADLRNYNSIKDYGKAIVDAWKRLRELSHPIESWVLAFYFLDRLISEHNQFRSIQIARFAEESIQAPTYKGNKIVEETKRYTKIKDLVRILIQDQANHTGLTSDMAMRAGPPGHSRGRGRGDNNRGRGSSSRGRRGSSAGGFAQSQKKCSMCGTEGHHHSAYFYTHPELAPKGWRKKYPTEAEHKVALLLRRAKNQQRKTREDIKNQQQNQQGSSSSGDSENQQKFVANICLPYKSSLAMSRLTMAAIKDI